MLHAYYNPDYVVGWPQGADVDGFGDAGDSRWPSTLDDADARSLFLPPRTTRGVICGSGQR
jgi:hypothetical protein